MCTWCGCWLTKWHWSHVKCFFVFFWSVLCLVKVWAYTHSWQGARKRQICGGWFGWSIDFSAGIWLQVILRRGKAIWHTSLDDCSGDQNYFFGPFDDVAWRRLWSPWLTVRTLERMWKVDYSRVHYFDPWRFLSGVSGGLYFILSPGWETSVDVLCHFVSKEKRPMDCTFE